MSTERASSVTNKRSSTGESKTEEICNRLRTLAYEKGPGVQLPTVRTLCELLDTTYITLGEALDRLEAEHIIYRKQRQGIYVSPRLHHKSIMVLFESSCILFDTSQPGATMSPFWSMLWVRLEHEAQHRATSKAETCTFQLVKMIEGSNNRPSDELIDKLRGERLDGILSINLNLEGSEIETWPVPSIVFAGNGPWIVEMDGKSIGRQAAQSLIQQGCRKIGLWLPASPHASPESYNELHGVRQALSTHNVPYLPELTRQAVIPPSRLTGQHALTHQEQGYLLAREIFGPFNSVRPDGLFIADDLITDGALVALDELGIQVGKDIKLATHANAGSPILFGRTKHMSVFEYDPNDVVQAMFALLDQLLTGQAPEEKVTWILPRQRIL